MPNPDEWFKENDQEVKEVSGSFDGEGQMGPGTKQQTLNSKMHIGEDAALFKNQMDEKCSLGD